MKTVITITIEHDKPLPGDLLDIVTERAWNRCAAKGMMCEVNGGIDLDKCDDYVYDPSSGKFHPLAA